MILLLELVRGLVVQTTVGSHGVVVLALGLDDLADLPA
jgi:hypothetical protein